MSIFKHEWRQNFKSVILWSAGISIFLSLYVLIYPTFSSQISNLTEVVKNMGNFTAAFGLTEISMGTALGFFAVEASLVLSIGGAIFASNLGISMVAKEEAAHTSDFLMTGPQSRNNVLIQKLLTLLIYIVLFELICYGATLLSFALINETVNRTDLTRFFVGQLWLHLQIAMISFGLSCLTKRLMNGLGIALTLILYFLTLFSNVSDELSFIKYISPFSYAKSQVVLPEVGLDWTLMGLGLVYALIVLTFGFVYYNKKDLGT